jgi:hypothetical protein
MHPALAPEALAARKAELGAEAGNLRREFRESAAAFKPTLDHVQLGVSLVRELSRFDVAAPALFGISLGGIGEREANGGNLFGNLMDATRLIAKGWKIVQSFQNFALPSETPLGKN